VWCAADQRKALTDAKLDKPVAKRTCTNPVTMDYALGQRSAWTARRRSSPPTAPSWAATCRRDEMLARLDRAAARGGALRSNRRETVFAPRAGPWPALRAGCRRFALQ
jgi:thiol:disulfide interchange protein DsbC